MKRVFHWTVLLAAFAGLILLVTDQIHRKLILAECARLEAKFGSLKVDDPSLFYVRQIETGLENTVAFRVHMPPNCGFRTSRTTIYTSGKPCTSIWLFHYDFESSIPFIADLSQSSRDIRPLTFNTIGHDVGLPIDEVKKKLDFLEVRTSPPIGCQLVLNKNEPIDLLSFHLSKDAGPIKSDGVNLLLGLPDRKIYNEELYLIFDGK